MSFELADASLREAGQVSRLIKIAMVIRLLTLLAAMVGFVDSRLSVAHLFGILFAAGTSMLVLGNQQAVLLICRHPLLIVMDTLVMTGLMFVVGVDNSLTLASLSTALVIGLVLSVPAAALAAFILVGGYLVAASLNFPEQGTAGFVTFLGVPVMCVSLVVLGEAFRSAETAQRAAERAFVGAVTSATAAEERSRLARELHDSTAKTLQGLSLGARSLHSWITREPERARRDALDLAEAADEAVLHIRHLLSAMRQDQHDQPFAEVVRAVCDDFRQVSGLRVRLRLADQVEGEGLTDPSVRYELLACLREALLNVQSHARATAVDVSVTVDDPDVTLVVADNGAGFDLTIVPDREREGHFGLRGFTERMEAVGGTARVSSRPGAGTQVELVAPTLGLRAREVERG